MYWILVIMAAIAATLIALVVGGLVTPAEYRVVRRMRLQRSADDIHALLTDLSAYEQWAPSPSTIQRQASSDAQLIVLQVTLGNQLIWVYGLHTVPVVQAMRSGLV